MLFGHVRWVGLKYGAGRGRLGMWAWLRLLLELGLRLNVVITLHCNSNLFYEALSRRAAPHLILTKELNTETEEENLPSTPWA